MNGNKVSVGDEGMTNANQQSRSSVSGSVVISAAAIVLILVGVVFQMAELATAHAQLDNSWLFSVLASNIWNILSLRMNVSAMQDFLRFWPLLLVSLGLAIMLATRQNNSRRLSGNRKEGSRDL
jgi:Ca2+/Na+ antiporter